MTFGGRKIDLILCSSNINRPKKNPGPTRISNLRVKPDPWAAVFSGLCRFLPLHCTSLPSPPTIIFSIELRRWQRVSMLWLASGFSFVLTISGTSSHSSGVWGVVPFANWIQGCYLVYFFNLDFGFCSFLHNMLRTCQNQHNTPHKL